MNYYKQPVNFFMFLPFCSSQLIYDFLKSFILEQYYLSFNMLGEKNLSIPLFLFKIVKKSSIHLPSSLCYLSPCICVYLEIMHTL